MNTGLVFREEKNGGYRFNRGDGTAHFLEGEAYQKAISDARIAGHAFEEVSRPTYSSDLALTAPLAVWHETTLACNLNCSTCVAQRTSRHELDLAAIDDIYEDLAASGVFEVRITGGEACMRPDIAEVVESANGKGLYVSLTSNGVYTTQLRETVASLPVRLFIISLDGTKQANDAIRGEGSYDSTVRTLDTLIAAGKNVRVNTVVMQQTKECIEELVHILHDRGIRALTLIPLRPAGEAVKDFSKNKLSPDEYRRLVQLVGSLRTRYPGFSIATNYDILSTSSQGANVPSYWSKMCMAGIEGACISPDGELRACIVAAGVGVAGSLLERKLYQLWHDDTRWGIFRDMKRRVLSQCRNCADYAVKCPGSCIAMTEFSRSPKEMYCFKHLI